MEAEQVKVFSCCDTNAGELLFLVYNLMHVDKVFAKEYCYPYVQVIEPVLYH